MGATTAAVGLAVWINSAGGKVCYIESNQSGCLGLLARAYEMEKTEDGFAFDGVEYLNGESVALCNFIIHDIGRDYAENAHIVETADILLLCCGIKPYEMQYTAKLLRQFETVHAFVICPFVDDSLKESYAPVLQSDYHRVIFMEYQPDMMNTGANNRNHKAIIQKYIAGA